ncbi:MAG TPA: GNAT family N-acetyltransferase [Acidimicrobiales bacterium]|nr:GNAT family N-acetyltransferase [Acidimicrobiales bacterium]
MAPEEIALPPLRLRRWQPADAPRLLAAVQLSLPELRRFMPWAMETPSLETVAGFLDVAWRPPESYGFGLFDDAGEVVGGFGLHGRRGPGILEIGYWVRSDRARQGYATAAAGALTDMSFASFPATFRVEIRCDPANAASAAVAAKLGYQLAGEIGSDVIAAAQTGVQQVWAVSRTTWAAEPRPTWRPSAGRPAPPAAPPRRR